MNYAKKSLIIILSWEIKRKLISTTDNLVPTKATYKILYITVIIQKHYNKTVSVTILYNNKNDKTVKMSY